VKVALVHGIGSLRTVSCLEKPCLTRVSQALDNVDARREIPSITLDSSTEKRNPSSDICTWTLDPKLIHRSSK
jgi:hypothetical protein